MSNAADPKNPPESPTLARELSRRHALQGLGALVLGAAACDAGERTATTEQKGVENTASTDPRGTEPAAAASGNSARRDGGAGSAGAAANKPNAAMSGSSAAPSAGTRAQSAGNGAAGASGSNASAGNTAGAAGASSTAGAGGQQAAAGAAASGTVDFAALDCLLTPELTEGPFFIDEKLNRSDLIAGEEKNVSSGCPLELTIGLFNVDGDKCSPLTGVQIDIWHADIDGIYSDVESGFFQPTATAGKKFLRGYQVSDEQGVVSFKTIYPGWYGSRAIHIHFKVRVTSGGSAYEFTSQLFFDETINDKVMALPAYNTRGARTVLNKTDQVFNGTGPGAGPDNMGPPAGQKAPGEEVLAALSPVNNGSAYKGVLKIGVKMS